MRYLEDFLQHLEHARGVSRHTLSSYRSDLRRFASELPPALSAAPERVGTPLLRGYVSKLLLAGYERTTVARHAAAIRSFYRYLVAEGFAASDPAASLRPPRRHTPLPAVLDDSQMDRLLRAPSRDTFVGNRDRALLETLYSAGLRVSELVGLDLGHLDLEEGLLRVAGKGSRERMALLGSHARSSVRDYLPGRLARLRDSAGDPLFINRLGTRLSDRSVRRSLQRYIVKAGLPGGVTPHTLRHTFATHLLQRGAGLKEVQELLGHLHLSSTQVYTHVSPEHLRRVYEQAHPRAARRD